MIWPLVNPHNAIELKHYANNFYKFMIVREPMERLASCYYDKIIINPAKSLILFRNAIKKAISKSQKIRRKFVTFADFLQVIVIGKRGNATNFGRHWLPFYSLCTPCSIEYDYIGKFENMSNLLDSIGANTTIWKNKKMSSKKSTHFVMLIKSVPREILVKTYQTIKLDYELFDYNFNNVLKIANYSELSPEEDIYMGYDV